MRLEGMGKEKESKAGSKAGFKKEIIPEGEILTELKILHKIQKSAIIHPLVEGESLVE